MKYSVSLICLVSIALAGCSSSGNTNSAATPAARPSISASVTPPESPSTSTTAAAPPQSQVKSLPPSGGDIPRPGEVKGYKYNYKKDETKTVATFLGKLLPADNNSMFDAVRDVVERSYGDKVVSAPRISGSGPSRTMRVSSKLHDYLVVLVNNEQGEVLALIVTQMELEVKP